MTNPTEQEDVASKAGLFEDLPQPSLAQQVQHTQAEIARRRSEGAVRLLQPNRLQVELRASDLESLLPEDHRARLVWGYVVRQDLSKLIEAVKARGSNAGRAAIDPHILFALWLYATLEGVGSGREVTRLSQEHDAYRWICGGVSVNYHAINDFRAGNATLKDELLKDNVAALAAAGAISLERVAQDGMRVRADAGAASFGRQASLQEHLKEASELVQTLKTQAQTDPGQAKRQAQAAKLRAVDGVKQHVRRVASRRNVTRWLVVVSPVFVCRPGSNGNRPRRACRNERVARLEASPARTSMGSTAHTCAAGTADLSNRPRIISLARCARHSLTRRCKVRNCALLA